MCTRAHNYIYIFSQLLVLSGKQAENDGLMVLNWSVNDTLYVQMGAFVYEYVGNLLVINQIMRVTRKHVRTIKPAAAVAPRNVPFNLVCVRRLQRLVCARKRFEFE